MPPVIMNDSNNQEQISPVEVCAICGNPGAVNRGSITGWIFGSKKCTCDRLNTSQSTKPQRLKTDPDEKLLRESERVSETSKFPSTSAGNFFPSIGKHYECLSVIGQGGMGIVYKVTDHLLRETLAIKVLRSELARDTAAVERFEQEATAAAGLRHPNLVAVHGQGRTADGAPYLVTDYVDGKTLAQELDKQGRLETHRAINIFMQICQALKHAHGKGVIHRDLKPANIMLAESGRTADIVKVVDFGIAKVLSPGGNQPGNLTQTGDIIGSPLYMSPEQCKGEKITARSDIYALGCVMYETLTGRAAFAADNTVKIILKQIQETPLPPGQVARDHDIPRELDNVIMHCLEKDPSARYPSVDDLYQDLQFVKDGKPALRPTSQNRSITQVLRVTGIRSLGPYKKYILAAAVVLLAIWISVSFMNEKAHVAQLKRELAEQTEAAKVQSAPTESGGVGTATQKAIPASAPKREDLELIKRIKENPSIQEIDLSNSSVTDNALKALADAHSLTSLNLSDCLDISAVGFHNLIHLPLISLQVQETRVDDKIMADIGKIKTLQSLGLTSTDLSDSSCAHLTSLANLKELHLSTTPISSAALPYVSTLRSLESLYLDNDKFNGLSALSKLKLRKLTLYGSDLNNKDLSDVANIPTLVILDIRQNVKVTDQGLAKLGALKNLRVLLVGECSCSRAGVQALKASLPHLMVQTNDRNKNTYKKLDPSEAIDLFGK